MGISSKKTVANLLAEAGEVGEHTLHRGLGSWNLTALGVGAIIGAGIFVLTGHAAAAHAGPAVVLSFVLAGFACACAALCYAELASMIPVSGSAYTYAYATLGELVAWVVAWVLVLEYLFAGSTIAVGWSGYFTAMMAQVGVVIPDALSRAPVHVVDHQMHLTGNLFNLPAAGVVALVGTLLMMGVNKSTAVNNFIVALKTLVVILVVVCGFFYVNPANWHPFIPANTGEFGHFGWSGVLRASSVIFFAYIGFDAVSTAAQEAKNPQKDMPFGILMSLAVCTVLYILMALVMTGLVDFRQLGVPHPVFVALSAEPKLAWLVPIVNVSVVIGLASTTLAMIYGQTRIFYVMARDGLLPKAFARVNPKTRTPEMSTLIVTIAAALIAGLLPIDVLGELVSIGTLFAFVIVCIGVVYLRKTHPETPRSFKTPYPKTVATLGIISCVGMMLSLPGDTWVRLGVWLAIGFAIYFGYSIKHSKVGNAA
jgi:APA family basic amino acid/polyamine antiporter